jgi:hypothetical protein
MEVAKMMKMTARQITRETARENARKELVSRYVAAHADAVTLLASIQAAIQNLPIPEDENDQLQINWCDFGTLAEVARKLDEVAEFMGIERD